MTREDWCKYGTEVIAEADEYNAWRQRALDCLMIKVGPRIAKLGFYMGCGFHYCKIQRFGKLVDALALDWSPCANWCHKVEDDRSAAIINRVIFDGLLRDLFKAEKSQKEFDKARNS